MSKKKIIIASAVLVAAGAVAAISATGPRHGGGWHGERHGGWNRGGVGGGDGHDGIGRRGMLQRELTKDQYDAQVRERFARLDKNSDGFIDAGEIEGAANERRTGMMERMRGMRGGAAAGGSGEQLIQRFDTNKDGKVTRDEFLTPVRKRFAEADLNNDGRINDDDLPPMLRGQNAVERMVKGGEHGARGGRHGGHGERHGAMGEHGMGGRGGAMGGGRGFAFLGDVEVKDGAVTLDAVLAAAGRQFDRFDRNKDGALDKVDVDALRKDMTDYHVKRFIHANGADKDGKVSREQFFGKAAERFAEMDRDGDGRIGRGDGGRGMHGGGRGGSGMDGGDRPMRGPDGRGPGGPAPKQ